MTSSALTIRPLAPAEQEQARELILSGLGEHFGHIDYSLNPDLDDIAGHYLAQGAPFLSVWDGDRLVGTGCLIREAEGVSRIVRMSVHPDYRRRGIGRSLVAALVNLARERGDRKVVLETNRTWEDARGLYLRAGFTICREDEELVHMEMCLG